MLSRVSGLTENWEPLNVLNFKSKFLCGIILVSIQLDTDNSFL